MQKALYYPALPEVFACYLGDISYAHVLIPDTLGVYDHHGRKLALSLCLLADLDTPAPRDPYALEFAVLYQVLELVEDLTAAPRGATLALTDEDVVSV